MRQLSSGLLVSGFFLLAMSGCNAQIDAKVSPAPTASVQPAPSPKAALNSEPSTPPVSTGNPILEGRYWLGGTDEVLEVQGDRYRYETEGGTLPWQSLSSLQAVQPGVVYDRNTYWCLSTMRPATGNTACSEKGWVTQPETLPSKPAQSNLTPLQAGVYRVGSTYIQIAAQGERLCYHGFSAKGWSVSSLVPNESEGVYRIHGLPTWRLSQQDAETLVAGSDYLTSYKAEPTFSNRIDATLQECLDSDAPFAKSGSTR